MDFRSQATICLTLKALLVTIALVISVTKVIAMDNPMRGGIEFTFANPQIEVVNNDFYFSFDVMANGVSPFHRLGTGIVLINYNTQAFGTFIKNNNRVIVTKGTLTTTSPFPVYGVIVNDNQPNRLAVTYEYVTVPGWGNYLTSQAQQLINIKIRIMQPGFSAGLSFASSLMSNQQYLDDNATLFDPVIATHTITDTVSPAPRGLTISVVNGSVELAWLPIAGCTYTVYSGSDPHGLNWELVAADLSSHCWTGALQAPAKFYYVTANYGVPAYGEGRGE